MQEHPDIASNAPFLLLDEQSRIMLFPLIFLHQEASSPSNAISWKQIPCASNKNEFPVKKWVHIACEVQILYISFLHHADLLLFWVMSSLSYTVNNGSIGILTALYFAC